MRVCADWRTGCRHCCEPEDQSEPDCRDGAGGGVRKRTGVWRGSVYGGSAQKAAQFIMDCTVQLVPLIFLHDVNGFMAGKDAGVVVASFVRGRRW